MAPARILILCVALVAGIGAVVVLRGMAKSQVQPVAAQAAPKPMAQVLVAKRDLKPGERLTPTDMTWQPWPKEAVTPLFVVQAVPKTPNEVSKVAATATDIARKATGETDSAMLPFIDSVVREAFVAGEPMTDRKVVHAGQAGVMAITLTPGMRAMAVPLTAESAAGGFILPGDHVDVVQSRQAETGGVRTVIASTVLKNAKVLAIDQQTAPVDKGIAQVGATATLEVPLDQAEMLVQAKGQGQLTLVLRSYADTAGPSTRTLPRLADLGTTVRVYRSGQPSDVQVKR